MAVSSLDWLTGPGTTAAGASPAVADLVDLTDVLTAAALPTAFLLTVEVTATDRIVVHVPRAEVGQGITTAMGMVAAEELDARLDRIDVVLDDARPELLFNQLTGGSDSLHSLYEPMRVGAAAARARLVTAAAQRFAVPASSLVTRDSTVVTPDGRVATYGSLSADAARVTTPAVSTAPKSPDQFRVIGRPTTRLDARDIV